MSCQHSELYQYGKGLSLSAKDEASRRGAISRLYYASFHACREFERGLSSVGTALEARGLHEQLINRLDNPTISKKDDLYLVSKSLSKLLRALLTYRVTADYHPETPIEAIANSDSLGISTTIVNRIA